MTNNLKQTLPNILYYNNDHSDSLSCTEELSAAWGVTWALPSTWSELTDAIENGEDKIMFHLSMLRRPVGFVTVNISISDFVASINTITKFMPGHKPLKIMVIITPDTPRYMIEELQEAGVVGIGLDYKHYPVDEVLTAIQALVAGKSYWPAHIIDQLPIEGKKPVSIYFRKDAKEYFHEVLNNHVTLEMATIAPWNPVLCSNWDDLGLLLKQQPHQLIFHFNMFNNGVTIPEVVLMLETLIKVSSDKKIPIGVAIELDTPLTVVKEFQKSGIHGVIPSASSFGFVETTKGITALFNRIPYWPKHILEQLPGFVKKPATQSSLALTERQSQVFRLITERGASNKVIARALGISESTVKLHVSEIFKKYGVRTRTQLAVFSNS
jgi:DNA-binding NarL/FixJ family response regulator